MLNAETRETNCTQRLEVVVSEVHGCCLSHPTNSVDGDTLYAVGNIYMNIGEKTEDFSLCNSLVNRNQRGEEERENTHVFCLCERVFSSLSIALEKEWKREKEITGFRKNLPNMGRSVSLAAPVDSCIDVATTVSYPCWQRRLSSSWVTFCPF